MTTIARPYALAAFQHALVKEDLPAWESMLKSAAALTQDNVVSRLLSSPSVSAEKLSDLFCEVLAPGLSKEKTNFIRLLAENKRLLALPYIMKTFETLKAQYEKTVDVVVTSAVPLDESYKEKLKQALSKRLHRQVSMQCNVDSDLLGGVVVRAGDVVLDGSVRGKLNRMIDFI